MRAAAELQNERVGQKQYEDVYKRQLATLLDKFVVRKHLFDEDLQASGTPALILGLLCVAEGGLPLLLSDLLFMIPINCLGGGLAAASAYLFGVHKMCIRDSLYSSSAHIISTCTPHSCDIYWFGFCVTATFGSPCRCADCSACLLYTSRCV